MPNFVKLAEAYGAVGFEVEHESEVDRVLKKAFTNGRPTLIDVHVNPEEMVYPMVPAGASLRDMMLV
jgi:acetolactate synthase I/II/III large subunit